MGSGGCLTCRPPFPRGFVPARRTISSTSPAAGTRLWPAACADVSTIPADRGTALGAFAPLHRWAPDPMGCAYARPADVVSLLAFPADLPPLYFLLRDRPADPRCSPCADSYSIDAHLRESESKPLRRSILPLRMIQVFITVMHLFSFIGISNSGRLTGRIFELFHRGETLRGSLTPAVLSVVSYRALALMTLTIEGFLAFRFWVPMLRPFALLVGSLLRFGIDLMMSVTTFSYRMLARLCGLHRFGGRKHRRALRWKPSTVSAQNACG